MKSLEDRHAGHGLPAALEHLAIERGGVLPLHALEHLVAARLHRHVQIAANLGQIAHGLEQVVGHVLREVGDELDPLNAGRVVDFGQQVRQPHAPAVAQLVLVAVDGLAQQRDLLAPLGGKLANLGGEVLRVPALLRPAHARYDAISTELIAADVDADIGLERIGPHRRVAQRIVALEAALDLMAALGAIEAERNLQLAGVAYGADQLRQARELAGAADDVDVRGPAADQLLVFLRHAAEHAYNLRRMLPLVLPQPAERAVDLVLGVLANAAGVEKDDVGAFGLVRQLISLAAQTAHHQLAVEHVHLAADGFDVKFGHFALS